MKRILSLPMITLVAVALLGLAPAMAQTVTQTFTLQPGWNAIYLEVQPEANAMADVFAQVPVKSVWTFADRTQTVEFIFDADELPFNDPGWRCYFPPGSPESFLTSLHVVLVNSAFLVNLDSAVPVQFTVTGRPSPLQPQWTPDSFNLRGFPVSEFDPPAFGDYFAGVPAHAGRDAYRLLPDGSWQAVSPADPVVAGEAYLVYSKGASDFAGALDVSAQSGGRLDFGQSLDELAFTLRNRTDEPVVAALVDLSATDLNPSTSTDSNPLSVRVFDPASGFVWKDLPSLTNRVVQARETAETRLAIRRRDIPGNTYATVLEVLDSRGGRFFVPVTAAKLTTSGTAPQAVRSSRGIGLQATVSDDPRNHVGLWVGTATINAVSEPHSAEVTVHDDQSVTRGVASETPTPTRSTFNLRLIIHVDSSGQARLLKEVIQLWQNGVTSTDGSGNTVVDRPGGFVLITEDSRIGDFEGASLRDGEPLGRRISSVGIDFPGEELTMPGDGFALGGEVHTLITIEKNFPTNPFRHRKHPDHQEGLRVTRAINLEFDTDPPGGSTDPGFGETIMSGTYYETLEGLHYAPLHVSGTFTLSRVSPIGELNPTVGN